MSVKSYLEDLAVRAIVKYSNRDEKKKIDNSISVIYQRLEEYDEDDEDKNRYDEDDEDKNRIDSYFIFGSYKRGTIISREFDDNSDIDIMVVFSNNNHTPQTYLNYLKDFAKSKYPTSLHKQSFPAVVLELNHIKFDLVPAIIDDQGKYKIPSKDTKSGWITTNPNDLDGELVNNQNLRRLVRVAKIWNAKQEIYESYKLEKWIVQNKNIFRRNLNLDKLFYKFCEQLPINLDLPEYKQKTVERLQAAAKKAEHFNNENCIKSFFE